MQGYRPRASSFLLTWPLTFVLLGACSSGENGGAAPPDGGDGMPPCSLGTAMADIEVKLFQGPKCKTCHVRVFPGGPLPLYPTTFDIGTEGLAARVVDKMAEANPNLGKCGGRVLVPKNDPLAGIFVEKVLETKPSCGDRMPQAMIPLNADEVSCVKRWAILAAQSLP
jgi:hypothetical protein